MDTGAGNGKDRPHMPPLDHLDSGFLGALAEAGVQPAAVDVVINTHLHTDHIGWNTRRPDAGGGTAGDASWVPTFPNARYLMPEPDYRQSSPDGAHYPGRGGASVVARGDAFMVDDWLELPAI